MRNYELIFIIHPDLDAEAIKVVVEKVKTWITDAGGSVEKEDFWGKRRMAYSIRKQREGQYMFILAQMKPTFTVELDRNMRFLEPVLRYSLVSLN